MFLNISSVQSKVLRPGDFDHSTIRKFLAEKSIFGINV